MIMRCRILDEHQRGEEEEEEEEATYTANANDSPPPLFADGLRRFRKTLIFFLPAVNEWPPDEFLILLAT